MDDISQKLAGILNDPESMERVRKMAESILGEEEESPPQDNSFFDGINPQELNTIMSLIGKFNSSVNDPRANLLNALKPHLSEPRREKVDTAIKLLKIIELFPLLKESGILRL
jgi:hypothetical protein